MAQTLIEQLPWELLSTTQKREPTRKWLHDEYFPERRRQRKALDKARDAFIAEAKKEKGDVAAAVAKYESTLNAFLTFETRTRGFDYAELARRSELGFLGKMWRAQHKWLTRTGVAPIVAYTAWLLSLKAGPTTLAIGLPIGFALNHGFHKTIANGVTDHALGIDEVVTDAERAAKMGQDFKTITGAQFLKKNSRGKYERKNGFLNLLDGKYKRVSEHMLARKWGRLGLSFGASFAFAAETHHGFGQWIVDHTGLGDWLVQHGWSNWFVDGMSWSHAVQTSFGIGEASAAPHGGGGNWGGGGRGNGGGGGRGGGGNWGGGGRGNGGGGWTGGGSRGGGGNWSGGNGGGNYDGGRGSWSGGGNGGGQHWNGVGQPDRGTSIGDQYIGRGSSQGGGSGRGGWSGDRGNGGNWNGDRGGQGGRGSWNGDRGGRGSWNGDQGGRGNWGGDRGGRGSWNGDRGGRGGWNGDRGNGGGQGSRGWGNTNTWGSGNNSRGGGSSWGNNGGQSGGSAHGNFGVNDSSHVERFTTHSGRQVVCRPEVSQPREYGGHYYGRAENLRVEWRGHMSNYSGPVQYNEQYDEWRPVREYPYDAYQQADYSQHQQQDFSHQETTTCPPDKVELTYQDTLHLSEKTPAHIINDKNFGTAPAAPKGWVQAMDATHRANAVASAKAGGMNPDFLDAWKNELQRLADLKTTTMENLDPHMRGLWVSESHGRAVGGGVQYDLSKPVDGLKDTFTAVDHNGVTHRISMVWIAKYGEDVGCGNWVQTGDEIVSSHTIQADCVVQQQGSRSSSSSFSSVEQSNGNIAESARQMDRIPYTGADGARHFATGHDALIIFKTLNNGEMTFGDVVRNVDQNGYPSDPEMRAVVEQVRRMAPSFNSNEKVVTALQRLGFDN